MKTLFVLVLGLALGAVIAWRAILRVPAVVIEVEPITSPAPKDASPTHYDDGALYCPQLLIPTDGPQQDSI